MRTLLLPQLRQYLRFATQLQRDTSEVFRSRTHDDLANIAASSIKVMVKVVFQKCSGLFDGSVHDAVALIIEIFREKFGDQGGSVGRYLGWLMIHEIL